jgi:WD40 repeat protein
MSADPDPGAPSVQREGDGGQYRVDAGGALGVQVGEGNVQIIYSYGRQTWTDGVVPPPLAAVSGAIDSPYRGLNTFEERDAAFFFGREAAATQVLARMSRQIDGSGLLVISGVSGAGKSSLLRAGVLPRMRGTGLASAREAKSWPCLLFTPARAPLEELAVRVARLAGADAAAVRRGLDADPAGFALTARQAALAQWDGTEADPAEHGSRLLLVIDQFEQLFTQCSEEEQRRAFITALHAAATVRHGPDHEPAALVVLEVRADFEARCADYPELAGAIQDRYLVTAMTERQLRLAITEPAKTAGSRVEDDLTEELLREVRTRHPRASSAGMLPLLSHALDQTWRTRTTDILTLADYERTGGIEGAVADSAQRAYESLTQAQQALARQVFTRLTACSDGLDTAARASRAELTEGEGAAGAEDVEAVLEAFAAERLLILAAGTVEISHEILLTAWPLLRDVWLAETHADRIVRSRLDDVAAEWLRNSRDPIYLYTGSLLAAATETASRINVDPARYSPLSQTERDFLQASNRAHRRHVRRRDGFVAFLMALVVGFALLAVAAFHASQEAVHQRDVAASGQLINESQLLGDVNPTVSKLLSVAAWRISPSAEARYAMLAAAASPGIAAFIGHTDRVHSVAFSPDGSILVTGSYDGTVRLWDVATHRQIGAPLAGHDGQVYSVAFSRDGKTVASGADNGLVRLWDVATHRQIGAPLAGHDREVDSVAFSPDRTTLATGADDGIVRLWDVATHRQIGAPLTGHDGEVYSVAFSPDGKTLATAGVDGTVQLWTTATPHRIGDLLNAGAGAAYSVAFSPDGKTLATGSADGMVRLWELSSQRMTRSWPVGSQVFNVAFSPDGKLLATGNLHDTARLWDLATLQPIGSPFIGYSLAFSPDGKTLATGSYDHIARLWSVVSQTGAAVVTGDIMPVYSVAFSRDGKTLATGGADGTVQLWVTATRERIGDPLNADAGAVYSVAFSRDGKTLATGADDGTVQLWDTTTRERIGDPLNAASGPVYSVAFSRDGKTLATGGADGTVRLWDTATWQQIGDPFNADAETVRSVSFSPDGKTLATGGADNFAWLWDTATQRQLGTPVSGHAEAVYSVAFSPDGKTLATGGADDTVRLWDTATRQPIGDPLIGHADWVLSVVFSPDGKTLVSGSMDGTVRLWDVATRQQIGDPLDADAGPVYSVAFSPDGKTLASGIADGTARLWDLAYLAGTAARLCESAQRSLTRAEWAQYVPPGPAYQTICP